MKASIVYNTDNEPRVLIELQSAEERRILTDKVNVLKLIRVGYEGQPERVTDLAFEVAYEATADV